MEPTKTDAAQSSASKGARDIAAESVKAAIEQVTGESAAAESTAEKTEGEESAAAESEADEQSTESGEETEQTAKQANVLKGDDLKKYVDETPIWDLDLQKLPEELRDATQRLRRRGTKDYQELRAEQKRVSEGKDDRKPKTELTTETGREGEKPLSRDELYELMMSSPEGMEKAFDAYIAQKTPTVVEKITRAEQARQQERTASLAQQTMDALENLRSGDDERNARVPELANKDFQEAVARIIDTDERIASRIADAKSIEEIEDAIELAASRVRRNAPAKPKPNDGKSQDHLDRERRNAQEKGSIAARKGSKVGTADDGKMTVEKSLQLAKERIAAGNTVV